MAKCGGFNQETLDAHARNADARVAKSTQLAEARIRQALGERENSEQLKSVRNKSKLSGTASLSFFNFDNFSLSLLCLLDSLPIMPASFTPAQSVAVPLSCHQQHA